jgi:hypothetical protein
MTQTGQIEIPLSKKKMTWGLIISIIFIGAGIWMIFSPPEKNHLLFGNSTFLFVAGLTSVLFFGLTAIVIVKKIPDNKAGLIINDEGIFDNSNGVSTGLVLWTDIKEIKVAQVMSQKFLMFIVNNPQDYIDRQTNTLKKKGMQMNLNFYGSPISISANALTTNFDNLYGLLQQKFNEKKA